MEKQIKEMSEDVAQAICKTEDCAECKYEYCSLEYAIADKLFNKGYRKVDEYLAIQCTCYAIGCQEGEKIKQTTAKEIIDLANEVLEFFEKDDNLVAEHKVCIRLALKFFKLKIMERYGV